MPRKALDNCIRCGRHKDECGELSARNKCYDCGTGVSLDQMRALNAHSGDQFKLWRAKSILAMGGVLPDDLKDWYAQH